MPADLDIPILGQLTPAQLPLGDALEPGPLEIISLDAPLGRGALREQPLEHPPRHPDHAMVLADLDPELHRLPLGIPAGVLGEVKIDYISCTTTKQR
jgi:hypothetical protein